MSVICVCACVWFDLFACSPYRTKRPKEKHIVKEPYLLLSQYGFYITSFLLSLLHLLEKMWQRCVHSRNRVPDWTEIEWHWLYGTENWIASSLKISKSLPCSMYVCVFVRQICLLDIIYFVRSVREQANERALVHWFVRAHFSNSGLHPIEIYARCQCQFFSCSIHEHTQHIPIVVPFFFSEYCYYVMCVCFLCINDERIYEWGIRVRARVQTNIKKNVTHLYRRKPI